MVLEGTERYDSLLPYGFEQRWITAFDELGLDGCELGRVVRQDRGFVVVRLVDEEALVAVRTRKTGAVVVGDWVAVQHETVVEVLPRVTYLTRQDTRSTAERPIVANVDLVLIVCGADRPLNIRRIERATTQVWEAGATPVVVITKGDIVPEPGALVAEVTAGISTVEVLIVSSVNAEGLEELSARMSGLTSIALGESGAGKSTLLNALVGSEVVATGDVREGDSKGRHTTTRRELHVIPTGGTLIDSPGIRALGLWAESQSVDATFPDISEVATECKFADCRHESEPGCAINDGVESGRLDLERVEAWKALRREVEFVETRKVEYQRRKSEKKFGRLVDEALRFKGKR